MTFPEINNQLEAIQEELEAYNDNQYLTMAAGTLANIRWQIEIGAQRENETSADMACADG
jgi:hypothetical protein